MKLTKLQRYTAYCIMLAEAENPTVFIDFTGYKRKTNDCGVCFMASRIFSKDPTKEIEHIEYGTINKMFPEYFKRFYPLEGSKIVKWKIRKDLLQQCINETHP